MRRGKGKRACRATYDHCTMAKEKRQENTESRWKSAVKTYNYNLAKWLNEILTPVVDTTHMLKDTYDFVNKISTLDSNVDRYQVSFDFESLFTSVPTKETIDIILDMVYTVDVKLPQPDTERTQEASDHLHARIAFPVQREVLRSN
jgi:hypothetical protein